MDPPSGSAEAEEEHEIALSNILNDIAPAPQFDLPAVIPSPTVLTTPPPPPPAKSVADSTEPIHHSSCSSRSDFSWIARFLKQYEPGYKKRAPAAKTSIIQMEDDSPLHADKIRWSRDSSAPRTTTPQQDGLAELPTVMQVACDVCDSPQELCYVHPLEGGWYCRECALRNKIFEEQSSFCCLCSVHCGNCKNLQLHAKSKKHLRMLQSRHSAHRGKQAALKHKFQSILAVPPLSEHVPPDEIASMKKLSLGAAMDAFEDFLLHGPQLKTDPLPLPAENATRQNVSRVSFSSSFMRCNVDTLSDGSLRLHIMPAIHSRTNENAELNAESQDKVGITRQAESSQNTDHEQGGLDETPPPNPSDFVRVVSRNMSAAEIKLFSEDLEKNDFFGFDTETAPLGIFPFVHRFHKGPHLIQLCTENRVWLYSTITNEMCDEIEQLSKALPWSEVWGCEKKRSRPHMISQNSGSGRDLALEKAAKDAAQLELDGLLMPSLQEDDDDAVENEDALVDTAHVMTRHSITLPPFLENFFQRQDKTLVGFATNRDKMEVMKLFSKLGGSVRFAPTVDLCTLFETRVRPLPLPSEPVFSSQRKRDCGVTIPANLVEGRAVGAVQAAARVFRCRFDKSKKISCSNWALGPRRLSAKQQLYAAKDALLPLLILHELQRRICGTQQK